MAIKRLGLIRNCNGCKKALSSRKGNSSHDLNFTMNAYRDDIPDGHGGFMVPRHASILDNHLSSKCLRLAVPRQELEEMPKSMT